MPNRADRVDNLRALRHKRAEIVRSAKLLAHKRKRLDVDRLGIKQSAPDREGVTDAAVVNFIKIFFSDTGVARVKIFVRRPCAFYGNARRKMRVERLRKALVRNVDLFGVADVFERVNARVGTAAPRDGPFLSRSVFFVTAPPFERR